MKYTKRLATFILLTTTAAIAGCAVGWSKPNGSLEDFNQDRYKCEQQASQQYPVTMVSQTIGTGYQAPANTSCQSTGRYTNCVTTGGNYIPPSTINTDANAANRSLAFSSCMSANGYTFKMEFQNTGASAPSIKISAPPPNIGGACTASPDCSNAQFCYRGRCETPSSYENFPKVFPTLKSVGADGQCVGDEHCKDGLLCSPEVLRCQPRQ